MKWIIRGLYNRAVFPKTAPGGTVEILASAMQDTAAKALRVYGAVGYEPGDPLEESWVEPFEVSDLPASWDDHDRNIFFRGICNFFYIKYNRDDRPDGKTERSFSMGDCIQIAVTESEIHTFACRAEGWEEINYGRQTC